jgi:hypothetical protein
MQRQSIVTIKDKDCYITKVVQKVPSIDYYIDQAYPVKPLVTYYKKNKVLPYGLDKKQTYAAEKLKGVCYGCDEPNFNVEWIWSDEYRYYELKNACDECMACGLLCGEDCENF